MHVNLIADQTDQTDFNLVQVQAVARARAQAQAQTCSMMLPLPLKLNVNGDENFVVNTVSTLNYVSVTVVCFSCKSFLLNRLIN